MIYNHIIRELTRTCNIRKYKREHLYYKFRENLRLINREARVVFSIALITSQIKCMSEFNYNGLRSQINNSKVIPN